MPQDRYITVAEFSESYDSRLLAQLGSDTGVPGLVNESNSILLNAIEQASGNIEAAALVGGRYTSTDLVALVAEDDWHLKSVTAALAIGHLYDRRGGLMPDTILRKVRAAHDFLAKLREGIQIFPESESAAAAGKSTAYVVTSADRQNLRLVSETPYFDYWPDRLVP